MPIKIALTGNPKLRQNNDVQRFDGKLAICRKLAGRYG